MSESFSVHGDGDLYGIVNAEGAWVVKPALRNFVGATALAERMCLCSQLASGEIKLTVPVMARLGIDPVVYEDFQVYY